MGRDPDRYEPLPGLPALPAFLWRKLGRRGRRIGAGLIAGALVAGAVGLVVGGPQVERGKRERAAADAREEAAARAARRAALTREQRPVPGRGAPAAGLAGEDAVAARRASLAAVEDAVGRDARARVASGRLRGPIRRVACEPYPRRPRPVNLAARPPGPVARLSCLAVTAELATGRSSVRGAIGHPYRARLDFPSGRFALCKVSGRPGEGAIERDLLVTVPPACGGARPGA